jgi:hypothetical protein
MNVGFFTANQTPGYIIGFANRGDTDAYPPFGGESICLERNKYVVEPSHGTRITRWLFDPRLFDPRRGR